MRLSNGYHKKRRSEPLSKRELTHLYIKLSMVPAAIGLGLLLLLLPLSLVRDRASDIRGARLRSGQGTVVGTIPAHATNISGNYVPPKRTVELNGGTYSLTYSRHR